MELKTYLNKQTLSCGDFGKLIGVTERAVIKWQRGERIPRQEYMQKIIAATGGEVTPNDFFSEDAA